MQIVAATDVDLFRLSRDDLERTLKDFPAVQAKWTALRPTRDAWRALNQASVAHEYTSDGTYPSDRPLLTQVVARIHLSKMPLFKGAAASFLHELSFELTAQTCPDGHLIIRANDVAEEMFFIVQGSVQVYSEEGTKPIYAELGAGSFLGEIGILHATRRTASVRCVGPVWAMKLNKDKFETVLGHYPMIAAAVRKVAEARLENSRKLEKKAVVVDEFDIEVGKQNLRKVVS